MGLKAVVLASLLSVVEVAELDTDREDGGDDDVLCVLE